MDIYYMDRDNSQAHAMRERKGDLNPFYREAG